MPSPRVGEDGVARDRVAGAAPWTSIPSSAVEGYGVRARGGAVPDEVVQSAVTVDDTPASPLPRAPVPLAVVPMRLPSTLCPCETLKIPTPSDALPRDDVARGRRAAHRRWCREAIADGKAAGVVAESPWCRSCRCLCSCPGCGYRSRSMTEDGVEAVAADEVARGGGGAPHHVLGGAVEDVHAVVGVARGRGCRWGRCL